MNDIQQTINHLTMLRKLDSEEKKKLYDVAISALGKQIPKKAERLTAGEPIKIGNMTFGKGTSIYKCPSCGTLIARHYVHCNACGQAIDWRNGDE